MGKSVGLIGDITGKVGNVVFYKRGKTQAARVYVSKPRNPKTAAQLNQRMKMALAGRLASIVPAAAIEGFGGDRSFNRGRFSSNVLLNSTSGSGSRVGIDERLIVFSEGAQPLLFWHTTEEGTGTVNSRSVVINTSLREGVELPAGYGERYVVLFLNMTTSQFDYAVTGIVTPPADVSSASQDVVSVKVGDRTSVYRAIIYMYPFAFADGDGYGRFRVSYVGTEDGTIVVDGETGERLETRLVFGRSVWQSSKMLPVVPPARAANRRTPGSAT